MKYLKTFNSINELFIEGENPSNFTVELKDFCESNLIYLIDEDFEVLVLEAHAGGFLIQLRKLFNVEVWFKWQDISDSYIAFINRLVNEYDQYKINTIEAYMKEYSEPMKFANGKVSNPSPKLINKIIKKEEIVNNTLSPDLELGSITIHLMKK